MHLCKYCLFFPNTFERNVWNTLVYTCAIWFLLENLKPRHNFFYCYNTFEVVFVEGQHCFLNGRILGSLIVLPQIHHVLQKYTKIEKHQTVYQILSFFSFIIFIEITKVEIFHFFVFFFLQPNYSVGHRKT